MTEKQLDEIAERWKGVKPPEWLWELGQVLRDGEPAARVVWTGSMKAAKAVYHSPEDIQSLLDEVRFLRGQLSDLCEDSRAVAEVARLRQVCECILHQIDDSADALAHYRPEWRGIEAEFARIKAIVKCGLEGVCPYCQGQGGMSVDSGGFTEWGEPISVWEKCQQCG